VIKDLGPAQQILGMSISSHRNANKLWLSQKSYVEKLLKRFNIEKTKSISTLLAGHFKLSSKQNPSSEKERYDMENVPYALAVCSLMYAMICTRSNLLHVVGAVSWIFSNPGKEHWIIIK